MFSYGFSSFLRGQGGLYQTTSEVDEQLKNPDCSLEDLLQIDGVVTELKMQNAKLISFLNKDKLKTLIEYITVEPEEDEQLRGHKFPYVACELLKCNVVKLNDYFAMTEKEYNQRHSINDEEEKKKVTVETIEPDLEDNYTNEKPDEDKNKENDEDEEEKENVEDDKEKEDNTQDDEGQKEEQKEQQNKDQKKEDNQEQNPEGVNDPTPDETKEEEVKESDNKKDEKIEEEQPKNVTISEEEVNKPAEKTEDEKKEKTETSNEKTESEVLNRGSCTVEQKEDQSKEQSEKSQADQSSENQGEEQPKKPVQPSNKQEEHIVERNPEQPSEKTEPKSEPQSVYQKAEKTTEKPEKPEDTKESAEKIEKIESAEKSEEALNENSEKSEKNQTTEMPKEKKKPEINNENRIELLDLLLNFVMTEEAELNYVLSGYFSALLSDLIDKYPSSILNYLFFERLDALEKIIYHSNIRGISLLSSKILNIENYSTTRESQEENKKFEESIKIRNNLIEKAITSITFSSPSYSSCENTLSLITELISSNKQILLFVINSEKILDHVLDTLSEYLNSEENYKNPALHDIYQIFLSFLIQLIKQIISEEIPQPAIKDSTIEPLYAEKIMKALPKILRNFEERKDAKKVTYSSGEEITLFGSINLKIIELVIELFQITKDISAMFDAILIRNEFIKRSVDFFFKYQWNDLYLQTFVNFIKIFLKEENQHIEFNKYLFENIKLHERLIKYINEHETFKYIDSGNVIKSGLHPHIINLCYKINTIIGNKVIRNRSREGSFNFILTNDSSIGQFSGVSQVQPKYELSVNIKKYLDNNWNNFMKDKIEKHVKLYEEKLCSSNSEVGSEEGENFRGEDEMETKDENFPFEEDQKNEVPNDLANMTVDEVDKNSSEFSDLNYWKFGYNNKEVESNALKDLGL